MEEVLRNALQIMSERLRATELDLVLSQAQVMSLQEQLKSTNEETSEEV